MTAPLRRLLSGSRTRMVASLGASAALALLAAPAGVAQIANGARPDSRNAGVEVLSSRPELVTGGDALVHVTLPGGSLPLRITSNGVDITSRFQKDPAR